MEREQKNQLLADLYALRAGMSAISIEKDKLDESEKNYNDAMSSLKKVSDEYNKYDYDIQRVNNGLNYCKSQLPRGYNSTGNKKQKRKSKYSKSGRIANAKTNAFEIFMQMIIPIGLGIVAAAVPWFFYFATSGAYQADKGSHPTFENSHYKNYIYVSIVIFAAIFIISLIVAVARLIKESRTDEKEKKLKIKDAEKSIRELNNELAGYQMERKLIEPKLNECYKVVSRRKAIVEKDREFRSKLSRQMYDRLVAQFKSVLDIRDWKHIDLIIFYFETGRADTLKEALQQVDRKVQADEIIEAIETAGQNISSTIRMSMNELRGDLNRSFAKLSVQLAEQHCEQISALNSISGNIEKTNESLAKLQQTSEKNGESIEKLSSATYLNNALLTKINYDSLALMSDVDYMVYSADKGGNVNNNTSYTLNVNLK